MSSVYEAQVTQAKGHRQLFGPELLHGLNRSGAAGRNESCGERGCREYCSCEAQNHRVVGFDSVKLA